MNILDYKLIAHRGLHSIDNSVPENSIISFENAIKKGYAVEIDINITKDNKVVVFHDNNLERMTGVNKFIEECDYEEISKLKLLNTDYSIPTLEEALYIIDNKVPILIELKNNLIPNNLETETLKILNNYNGRFMIQSFNPLTLLWFEKNAPNIKKGRLIEKTFESIQQSIKNTFFKTFSGISLITPDFISYKFSDLTDEIIEKYKKNNIPILCWTINNKEDFESASKLCDGIIFENIIP